ncbi:MAG UNVERIFIED_CONTAM: hypothetical protein LVR18_36625 [Planctomycetaceae bacterium]
MTVFRRCLGAVGLGVATVCSRIRRTSIFTLADALYRGGRLEAAVERYYCAIEWAPEFIEAWSQLGCLQAELEEFELAEAALRRALSIHSSNPDVLLSFAQLLDDLGREGEAVEYWRQYLRFDSRGPWSEHARMRAGGNPGESVGVELSQSSGGALEAGFPGIQCSTDICRRKS